MSSFKFRAIVHVRRIEPATRYNLGLEVLISARNKEGRRWIGQERDAIGIESIAKEIRRAGELKMDESATFDCVLEAWWHVTPAGPWGPEDYDAGTHVVRSHCIKTGQASTRNLDRKCYVAKSVS